MPKRMLLSVRTSGDLISVGAICENLSVEFKNHSFLPSIMVDTKYKPKFTVLVVDSEASRILDLLIGATLEEITEKLQEYAKKLRGNEKYDE